MVSHGYALATVKAIYHDTFAMATMTLRQRIQHSARAIFIMLKFLREMDFWKCLLVYNLHGCNALKHVDQIIVMYGEQELGWK